VHCLLGWDAVGRQAAGSAGLLPPGCIIAAMMAAAALGYFRLFHS
jgi:hypothetical protein